MTTEEMAVSAMAGDLRKALARIDEATKAVAVKDAALRQGIEIGRELPTPPVEP